MRSNFKRLGNYIEAVNRRNSDCSVTDLRGLSLTKEFRSSTSNIVGTDMSTYKVMHKYDFAANFMGLGVLVDKAAIVLKKDETPNIVSGAYPVFRVKDENILHPEYLMMWLIRSEFDRYCVFKSDKGIRGGFDWNDLLETELPIPSITKQRKIVNEYNTIQNRIALNQQLIQKLEETAQAIYKQWFVDFEFPDENGKPYRSNGGEMEWNEEFNCEIPVGWRLGELGDCIDFFNGYGFESEELLDEPKENCYSVFKMGNIRKGGGLKLDGTKSWIERKKCKGLERFVLKKGDLLMCMTDMKDNIGLLGNTALMNLDDEFIVNQRVGLIRTNNKLGISFRFLYLVTNSLSFLKDLRSRANRGVQVNLTTNEIVISKLIIADYRINNEFDKLLNVLFTKIEKHSDEIQLLVRLQKLLLSKSVTIDN